MGKKETRLLIIVSVIFILSIIVPLLSQTDKDNTKVITELDETKEYITTKLPYTMEVEERDTKPETIAYRIFFDFMKELENDGSIARANFTRFTRLSGEEEKFDVAVVFHVVLPEGSGEEQYPLSGKILNNVAMEELVWVLTIEKVENLMYTLTNIESTSDRSIGLPPVVSVEKYEKQAGIEGTPEHIDHQLTSEELQVTYNGGESWVIVPGSVEKLVGIDYLGRLREGSYVLSEEKTAFLFNKDNSLRIILSSDKGAYWEDVTIPSYDQVEQRLAFIGFTSAQEGYLIFTGERTMSFEAHFVFKTDDGGKTWHPASPVEGVHSMMTGAGFINEQLGFISFGEIRYEENAPRPHLYRTNNGAKSWEFVDVPLPEEYEGYFTVAEIPSFHEGEGTLLVNQGPEGDYLGGKVLAKFTSQDEGETWTFAGLVDPDGVLE